MTSQNLKVGDTVWVDGKPRPIIGETRVSWKVTLGDEKWQKPLTFPKKPERPDWIMTSEVRSGYGGYRVFLSKKDYDEYTWVAANKFGVARLVERVDFAVLHRVAELVGYTPLLPKEES